MHWCRKLPPLFRSFELRCARMTVNLRYVSMQASSSCIASLAHPHLTPQSRERHCLHPCVANPAPALPRRTAALAALDARNVRKAGSKPASEDPSVVAAGLEAAEKAVNKFVSRRLQPAVKKVRAAAPSVRARQSAVLLTC